MSSFNQEASTEAPNVNLLLKDKLKMFLKLTYDHNFTCDDLEDLDPTVFKFLSSHWSMRVHKWIRWLLFILTALSVVLLMVFLIAAFLNSRRILDLRNELNFVGERLAEICLHLSGANAEDLLDEKCLIPPNDLIMDISMPFQDCKFCENLSQISKISNITAKEFENEYAYSHIPVVVTDATKDWLAPRYFSYAMLRSLYVNKKRSSSSSSGSYKKVNQTFGNEEEDDIACQFLGYTSGFDTLREFFHRGESEALDVNSSNYKPWYVGWSNCNPAVGYVLREYYSRPYFLPQYSESGNMDWIFMGAPGHGAPMHIDHVKEPSWQAQLRGRKLWTLQPPYECRHVCPNSIETTVNPGDIIVLDTNVWFHSTRIIGDQLSITIGSEFD